MGENSGLKRHEIVAYVGLRNMQAVTLREFCSPVIKPEMEVCRKGVGGEDPSNASKDNTSLFRIGSLLSLCF